MDRYNHLNKYLINKFGRRTLKICVDGHFTCPNRNGDKGVGGCIFCSPQGAGENIKGICIDRTKSIVNQVSSFLQSYRGERADSFIVYFQAFSGTYDSLDNLKSVYDTALSVSKKIVGLSVATRPDLIDDNVAKLLSSYKDKYYVSVELGLQTANESIGKFINRCYTNDDYLNACRILSKYDIDVVTHIMVGLPFEQEKDIDDTVRLINISGAKGVKIHNTYVVKDTKLAQMYNDGKYEPISLDYYVKQVGRIISMLDKSIIVHRITGDPPAQDFVAPEYATHKKIMLNAINRNLESKNIFQGENL